MIKKYQYTQSDDPGAIQRSFTVNSAPFAGTIKLFRAITDGRLAESDLVLDCNPSLRTLEALRRASGTACSAASIRYFYTGPGDEVREDGTLVQDVASIVAARR